MMPRRLRQCAPPPRHRRGIKWERKPRSDFARQQRSLVESPPPKSPPMQRHRNHHIIIIRRNRQLVAEKFRERTPNRLIEPVLVPANQRGQTPRFILGSSAIARDSARSSIMWPTRKASRTPLRAASDGLQRSPANLAARIRHPLDPLHASRTNPPPKVRCESLPTTSAPRRIQEIKDVCESSHCR